MNQCIHNIDLLRWMMGDDIEEVMAYTDQLEHPYLEAEDLGMALVKFSNLTVLSRELPMSILRIWKRLSIFLAKRVLQKQPEQAITSSRSGTLRIRLMIPRW